MHSKHDNYRSPSPIPRTAILLAWYATEADSGVKLAIDDISTICPADATPINATQQHATGAE